MQKEREIHNLVIYLLEYNLIINYSSRGKYVSSMDFEGVGLTGHARSDVKEKSHLRPPIPRY